MRRRTTPIANRMLPAIMLLEFSWNQRSRFAGVSSSGRPAPLSWTMTPMTKRIIATTPVSGATVPSAPWGLLCSGSSDLQDGAVRLVEVVVYASDMERANAFYRDVLGPT